MTALREIRLVRAHSILEAGRELLDRVNSLQYEQIKPDDVGALEAALDIALNRLADLVDELAERAS